MASTSTSAEHEQIPWWRTRTTAVVLASALVIVPAGVLRALCAGHSCDDPARVTSTDVPFCSLPPDIRDGIAAGFREGRSADIVAVAGPGGIGGGTAFEGPGPPWLSEADTDDRVPIVLAGAGVRPGVGIAAGSGLDDIAPTVAAVTGFDRPHPEVRSGAPLAGPAAPGAPPRLVLEVIWKGVGSGAIEAVGPPFFGALRDTGAATMEARPGSLPLDPAAQITTIGTGGLPRQHGVTGTLVRNDGGAVVRAWSKRAPVHVVATLADDLDHRLGQRPEIGLVATEASDRGAVGGDWYPGGDRDQVIVERGASPAAQAATAKRLMSGGGFGSDEVTDLLVVVMEGKVGALDRALAATVAGARRASGGSLTTVVTATGDTSADRRSKGAEAARRAIEKAVPGSARVVAATSPQGLFLAQATLAKEGISSDQVVSALRDIETDSKPLFADAFPGITVSFARYC